MREIYAYIAGFLDADGHVGVHLNNNGTRWEGVSPQVSIVNRDRKVLEEMQSYFGGYITRRDRKHAWSTIYDWHVSCGSMERFLLCVMPYLRVKREQAQLVLELLSTRQDRRQQYRLDPVVRARREEIHMRVKQLNSTLRKDVVRKGNRNA